jgi:hypothetical protein
MGHVAEDASSIAHDLVGGMSFDVTDEPDTTHALVWDGNGEVLPWSALRFARPARSVMAGGQSSRRTG